MINEHHGGIMLQFRGNHYLLDTPWFTNAVEIVEKQFPDCTVHTKLVQHETQNGYTDECVALTITNSVTNAQDLAYLIRCHSSKHIERHMKMLNS